MELQTLEKDLKQWVKTYAIEEHTQQHFLEYLQAYRQAEPEEFAQTFPDFEQDDVRLTLVSICLVLVTRFEKPFYHLVAAHTIEYREKKIARFHISYTIGGEYLTEVWLQEAE